ncbi:MAG: glucose-6-phosphate isomerase [Pseudomonadota bacterium]
MSNLNLTDKLETLVEHRDRLALVTTKSLFEDDSDRFGQFSRRLGNVLFDFSKNKVDRLAFEALVQTAVDLDVEEKRDRMFAGEVINVTEGRAVLHTALRRPAEGSVLAGGADVMPQVRQVLESLKSFSESVRSGDYTVTGGPVTDVVNIGIGGSDLGPRMVTHALRPYHDGPRLHFVSNVDGADLSDTVKQLSPETTLFIVASKSFTTLETMTNAHSARSWLESKVGDSAHQHFVALSTNLEATREFGIPDERTFGFWDWVGGRCSVWSAIGLSVMMAIGSSRFEEFLSGAYEADEHFRTAPLGENIPAIMALLGVWHRNVCACRTYAILPYDNRMQDFPGWLQQLDMESNGKSVATDGKPVVLDTAPVVFGEPGTNGQHAFYQLIHQGTEIVPCDFLVAARGHEATLDYHHRLLASNCFAQSEALMTGRSLEDADGDPHRVFEGDRPSNTFLYEKLDPGTLGMLMALYEHKIFVQGALWNINSFDQWGVELGKELAYSIEGMIDAGDPSQANNGSTRGLLEAFQALRSD